MTTAHRPTFDPARGKEALRGPAYHQRLLPAHTQLKYRKAGQGGDADSESSSKDLAAQLLQAEAAHFKKKGGAPIPDDDDDDEEMEGHSAGVKRSLPAANSNGDADEEDFEAKRRRILEETRDIDADDDSEEEEDDDDDDDSSDDDEDAELQRELERVRREREEKKKKEEAERAQAEEDERERHIALGNPLLNKQDFTSGGKRRWDDDVVFKNQARGTEDKKKKEFVNDLLRSDFHRRFMSKYVR